jgi:DNA-binding Xre family transcriptional regulator
MNVTEIIKVIEQYEKIDKNILNKNVMQHIGKYKAEYIADYLGLTIHTVYGWSKEKSQNKIGLMPLLKICELTGVNIENILGILNNSIDNTNNV